MVGLQANSPMQDELIVKKYYKMIVCLVCLLPYVAGPPHSWLVALVITAVIFCAMLWLMKRMPLKKADVNASTRWLVIAFAVLMIGHALIIRKLIGLPVFPH